MNFVTLLALVNTVYRKLHITERQNSFVSNFLHSIVAYYELIKITLRFQKNFVNYVNLINLYGRLIIFSPTLIV